MLKKRIYLILKRIFDIFFSLILLVFSSPFILISAILIKIEDPAGPVFFRQDRGGKNNTTFSVAKFRTMITERERNGQKLKDSERMLRIGKILRKLSLDELPQILNILKGEMSFIGPRPLSAKFLPYYTENELRRHDVTPGISGWAQINGRNYLSWEEKFKLDIYYVENISLSLDAKIFFLTIKKVFVNPEVGILGKDVVYPPIPLVRKPRNENMEASL
ncbi:MAG: sugar transferase [Spirochaetes bacterium]|nr:sugar transferase [Spirochaetota bacterium]